MNWLFKEEPTHYGWEDFVRDGKTSWAGVRNPLAQKHLRQIKKGDRVLYYHTGNEKSVVGVARAVSDAYADPKDKSGNLATVDIAPVEKLPRPVTLAEIKARPSFQSFPLVRIPRHARHGGRVGEDRADGGRLNVPQFELRRRGCGLANPPLPLTPAPSRRGRESKFLSSGEGTGAVWRTAPDRTTGRGPGTGLHARARPAADCFEMESSVGREARSPP